MPTIRGALLPARRGSTLKHHLILGGALRACGFGARRASPRRIAETQTCKRGRSPGRIHSADKPLADETARPSADRSRNADTSRLALSGVRWRCVVSGSVSGASRAKSRRLVAPLPFPVVGRVPPPPPPPLCRAACSLASRLPFAPCCALALPSVSPLSFPRPPFGRCAGAWRAVAVIRCQRRSESHPRLMRRLRRKPRPAALSPLGAARNRPRLPHGGYYLTPLVLARPCGCFLSSFDMTKVINLSLPALLFVTMPYISIFLGGYF